MREIKNILFIGSKQIGLNCLKEIHSAFIDLKITLLTFDDSKDLRTVYFELQQYCADNNISFHIAQNKLDSELIIRSVNPDLCFVVGWYWLFNSSTIDSIPAGMIGIHNSLLPKYRGGSPLIWSIINGDKEIGFSIFSITNGTDTGKIWAQYTHHLKDNDTISSVLKEFEYNAPLLLKSVLFNLINDIDIEVNVQDESKATYCAQRLPIDGLIDWAKPAEYIFNFIRAQSSPYPGAYTYFNNKKLIIWSADLYNINYLGTPGQVVKVLPEGLLVLCGDNHTLLIKRVNYNLIDIEANRLIKSIHTRFTSNTLYDLFDSKVLDSMIRDRIDEYEKKRVSPISDNFI